MNKSELRKVILELRNKIPEKERFSLSEKITDNLFKLDILKKHSNIFCYLSTKFEVDTKETIRKLLKDNFLVCVPKIYNELMEAIIIDDKTLYEINKFGIFEPKRGQTIVKERIDVCIVPGLTFTKTGKRLGYGKGFYDKYLENLNCFKIGLCFNDLLSQDIPTDTFDVNVDFLITDKKIYRCVNQSHV